MTNRPCSRPTGLVSPYCEFGFRNSNNSGDFRYPAAVSTSWMSQINWRNVNVAPASPFKTFDTERVTTTVCKFANCGCGSTTAETTWPRTIVPAVCTRRCRSAGAVTAPRCAELRGAKHMDAISANPRAAVTQNGEIFESWEVGTRTSRV